MKLKLSENSLFAILLRKPWWISLLIAAVASLAVSAMLPSRVRIFGIFSGLPFLAISMIAFVKQWRAPTAAQLARTRETVMSMSWRDFADALEAAFRRDGYEVVRQAGAAADFVIRRDGRVALVSGKRWKAASTGIEPLRALHAAAEAHGVQESIFVTTGQLTDNARGFADDKRIRVIQDAGITQLLQGMVQA